MGSIAWDQDYHARNSMSYVTSRPGCLGLAVVSLFTDLQAMWMDLVNVCTPVLSWIFEWCLYAAWDFFITLIQKHSRSIISRNVKCEGRKKTTHAISHTLSLSLSLSHTHTHTHFNSNKVSGSIPAIQLCLKIVGQIWPLPCGACPSGKCPIRPRQDLSENTVYVHFTWLHLTLVL